MHRSLDAHWAWIVPAFGLAAAPGAHAQSANCEAFKARVVASIEAKGISGYALDFVPGGTATPPGARSVGTCDGGAYTLLYRRWAGAGAPAAAAVAASAVDARQAAQPTAQSASGEPSTAEPRVTSRAAARSKPAPLPRPAAEPAPVAAASQTPTASVAAAPSPSDAPAAPAPPPAAAAATTSFDDTARPVVWVVTGMLLVYAGVRLWRRWRYRRYYDEAGLPRGPRITL